MGKLNVRVQLSIDCGTFYSQKASNLCRIVQKEGCFSLLYDEVNSTFALCAGLSIIKEKYKAGAA